MKGTQQPNLQRTNSQQQKQKDFEEERLIQNNQLQMQNLTTIIQSQIQMFDNTQNTIEFCSTKTIEDICNIRQTIALQNKLQDENILQPSFFYIIPNDKTPLVKKPQNLDRQKLTYICQFAIKDPLMTAFRPNNMQRRAFEMILNKDPESLNMFVNMLLEENKAAWRLLRNVLTGGSRYCNIEKGYYNCKTIQLYHKWWMRLQQGTRLKVQPYILTLILTAQDLKELHTFYEETIDKEFQQKKITEQQAKATLTQQYQILQSSLYQQPQISDVYYMFLWCWDIKKTIVTEQLLQKEQQSLKKKFMTPTVYSMVFNNTNSIYLPPYLLKKYNPNQNIKDVQKCYALDMKQGIFTVFQQDLIGQSRTSPHVGIAEVMIQKKDQTQQQYYCTTHSNVVFAKDMIKQRMKDIKDLQQQTPYYVNKQQIYTSSVQSVVNTKLPLSTNLFRFDKQTLQQCELAINPKFSNINIGKLMQGQQWSLLKNQFSDIIFTEKDNIDKGGITWNKDIKNIEKISFNLLMLPLKTASFAKWQIIDYQFAFQHIDDLNNSYKNKEKCDLLKSQGIPQLFNKYIQTYFLQFLSNAYMSCKMKLGSRQFRQSRRKKTSSLKPMIQQKQKIEEEENIMM